MVNSHTTSITPAQHATRHSVGGADPLVDPLLLHHTQHEAGNTDALEGIAVAGSGVAVFDGTTASNAWVDLDLSSVVGSRSALVFLRVKPVGGTLYLGAKPHAGDGAPTDGGSACGTTFARVENGESSMLITQTDSSGHIDTRSHNVVVTYRVYVVAYIEL